MKNKAYNDLRSTVPHYGRYWSLTEWSFLFFLFQLWSINADERHGWIFSCARNSFGIGETETQL